MLKIDTQNRLKIPQSIQEVCDIDLNKETRLYISDAGGSYLLLLSNDTMLDLPCLGIVYFDKKFRFFLSKEVRNLLQIDQESQLLVYSLKGQLTIKKLG